MRWLCSVRMVYLIWKRSIVYIGERACMCGMLACVIFAFVYIWANAWMCVSLRLFVYLKLLVLMQNLKKNNDGGMMLCSYCNIWKVSCKIECCLIFWNNLFARLTFHVGAHLLSNKLSFNQMAIFAFVVILLKKRWNV